MRFFPSETMIPNYAFSVGGELTEQVTKINEFNLETPRGPSMSELYNDAYFVYELELITVTQT